MEQKTRKQPPVDRNKLLIALECCRNEDKCPECPYFGEKDGLPECPNQAADCIAYISYLEEQLEEAKMA